MYSIWLQIFKNIFKSKILSDFKLLYIREERKKMTFFFKNGWIPNVVLMYKRREILPLKKMARVCAFGLKEEILVKIWQFKEKSLLKLFIMTEKYISLFLANIEKTCLHHHLSTLTLKFTIKFRSFIKKTIPQIWRKMWLG